MTNQRASLWQRLSPSIPVAPVSKKLRSVLTSQALMVWPKPRNVVAHYEDAEVPRA